MREKLIELLDEVHRTPLGKEYKERLGAIADYLIQNGVTFAKDNKVPSWIPVSERLPDANCEYLAVVVCEDDERLTDIAVFYKTGWADLGGHNVSVTHWMPLPEPPKED